MAVLPLNQRWGLGLLLLLALCLLLAHVNEGRKLGSSSAGRAAVPGRGAKAG